MKANIDEDVYKLIGKPVACQRKRKNAKLEMKVREQALT